MHIGSVIKPGCLAMAIALLAGCGATSPAPQAARTAGARPMQVRTVPFQGAVTAKTALAYAHIAARQLDAKALFVSLVGTRIDPEGTPGKRGGWQVSYIGDVVSAPAGAPSNPYNRYQRRILIAIDAEGAVTATVTEEPGMPLGMQLMDAPLPQLDSQDAIQTMWKHQGGGYRGTVAKMVLCGQLTPKMMQRLIWKVSSTTQNGDRPVALDADTGELIGR